eukprot:Rmarinus@m.21688
MEDDEVQKFIQAIQARASAFSASLNRKCEELQVQINAIQNECDNLRLERDQARKERDEIRLEFERFKDQVKLTEEKRRSRKKEKLSEIFERKVRALQARSVTLNGMLQRKNDQSAVPNSAENTMSGRRPPACGENSSTELRSSSNLVLDRESNSACHGRPNKRLKLSSTHQTEVMQGQPCSMQQNVNLPPSENQRPSRSPGVDLGADEACKPGGSPVAGSRVYENDKCVDDGCAHSRSAIGPATPPASGTSDLGKQSRGPLRGSSCRGSDGASSRDGSSGPERPRPSSTPTHVRKYIAPMKKQSERKMYDGVTCERCEAFHGGKTSDIVRECARHRYRFQPMDTPDGYWRMDFTPTPPS